MAIYIFQIYIIIILGIILKPNKSYKNRKIYIIINFFIMIIVASIRSYMVGADTYMYYNAFKLISKVKFSELNLFRYEYGFSVLCKILSLIYNNPQILIIVTSIFIMSSVGYFIYKNSKDVVLSCYIFITLNIFFLYMTAMRQAIAIGFILISYEFLKNNKNIKFVFLILIASLFHKSAIICLLFLVIRNFKYRLKQVLYTLIYTFIAFILYNFIFNIFTRIFTDYTAYSSGIFSVSNYFGALIEAIVIFAIWSFGIYNLILTKKHKVVDRETDFLSYVVSLALLVSVLVIKMNVVNRILAYFSVFTIIWIPKALISISNAKNRFIAYIFVYIVLFAYWLTIIIARPEWTRVVPYKVFF